RSSFFSVLRRPPRSPLFPYPTLFRSRRGPPPTPPGAPAAPATGVPGTSDGHYGGTRGPPGSGCDSRQATPHSEVLLTSTNHCERSEEHTSELQSRENLVCRLLLEKKK